ncbi:beta-ketoadipyl CoA thiolase [Tumebacillus algifaecis]|uniref:acetyl-CoA C-acyltransferase n=1 Tax=Tumebacillus algifaecis TaxID=1214604 RepID=A0A223D524_9BACL|nr:acetyl-CoA C-acyltransferase [Tumebacillus algifaecis]ASS76692.1 beta-ketoadipyl CoA thiolase [Tumebacillus algifaecis]
MREAVIIDAVRTPIGRYGGALQTVRPDDLAAGVIRALVERTGIDPMLVDDVILGCANQAGEDNRNVARMALLLAGLPVSVPGVTVNRLCASGLEAVNLAARAVLAHEADVVIAGGVESMTRAPLVMAKAEGAFARDAQLFDTTIGWRFINPRLAELHPPVAMGETAERVAEAYHVSRAEQDAFALLSQQRAAAALASGVFREEIAPVVVPQKRGEPLLVEHDEHPRADTSLEKLAALRPAFRQDGTVTAGNSSGLNDGAAAVLVMARELAERLGLTPLARYVVSATAGVDPALMGIGPVPAVRKALRAAGLTVEQIDLFEINEAFAAQVLASVGALGIDVEKVNPNGGAIALGHPLGATGARMVATLLHQMKRQGHRYGMTTMCVGVGQGVATLFERIEPCG